MISVALFLGVLMNQAGIAHARQVRDASAVSSSLSLAVDALARRWGVDILLLPSVNGEAIVQPPAAIGSPRATLNRLVRPLGYQVVQVNSRAFIIRPGAPVMRPPVKKDLPPVVAPPDIVVNARRRDEAASSVPIALSAITGKDLKHGNIRQLNELSFIVPGLLVTGQGSLSTPMISIRGQHRTTGDETRLSVVTYFADVPMPNQGATLPFFDIASVQVLRGPQGTLFGRNTTGGAILIYPARPDDKPGGYVQISTGNYGLFEMEGAVNIALPDDRLRLRVAGLRARRDGFVRDLEQGIDRDDMHLDAGRLSLSFQPNTGFSSHLVIDHLRADETGAVNILSGVYPNPPSVVQGGAARTPANAPYFDCGMPGCDVDEALAAQRAMGIRTVRTNLPPMARRRLFGIANTLEWGDDALKLKAIGGYRTASVLTANDSDGTPLSMFETITRARVRQLTGEVQVQGQARDGRLRWLTGLFLLDSRPVGINGVETHLFQKPGELPSFSFDYRSIGSRALFGQVTVQPFATAPQLSVDAGMRYTWDRTHGCAIRVIAAQANISDRECRQIGGSTADVRLGALTWTFGLTYRPTDRFMAYVTTRRAYRAGGYNTPTLGSVLAKFQTYQPETLTDVEIGLKGDWRSGAWTGQGELAVYRGNYAHVQRPYFPQQDFDGDGNPANDPITLIVNAAQATMSGLELSAGLSHESGFSLSAFASHIDARFDSFAVDPILMPLMGNDLFQPAFGYAPSYTFGATARYAVALAPDGGTVTAGMQYSRIGKTGYASRARDTNGIQPAYDLGTSIYRSDLTAQA